MYLISKLFGPKISLLISLVYIISLVKPHQGFASYNIYLILYYEYIMNMIYFYSESNGGIFIYIVIAFTEPKI
jgi:hypothetical protein